MSNIILRNSKLQSQISHFSVYVNNKIIFTFLLISITIILCYINLLNHFYYIRSLSSQDVIVYDDAAKSAFQNFLNLEGDIHSFVNKPMQEKCSIFTDSLISNDWSINDLKDLDYAVDAQDSKRFFSLKFKELNDEEKKDSNRIKEIFRDLENRVNKNNKIESLVSKSLSNLRIYEKCYIDHDLLNHDCLDVESRLFPWLTFESPIFERWDGTVLKNWPNLLKFYKEEHLKYKHIKDNGCFMNILKNNFKGRGIAISIGDQLKAELINLITILRYLGNELPIQLVHKGDLDFKVKQELIEISRNDILIHDGTKITGFKQELWFVDTKRCFREIDYDKFNKFSNKWLLVLFNSFDDMLLMDTDAVPFIKPNDFFKLGDYLKHGLFFFKDRQTKDKLHVGFDKLLYKLLPQDLEHLLFGINKVTDKTLKNAYFAKKAFHFMESGIVALNKRKHLAGVLASVQLQFWKPISKYSHGDKELFWLGQALTGDENFEFNEHHAGAIGELRKQDYNIADSIVGIQPAHISNDGRKLLWVNSGLEVCKRHSWKDDYEKIDMYKSKFKSEEDLKNYYTDLIKLRSVIIPPDAGKIFQNDIGEPERGWNQRKEFGCDEYYWGAYSRVGPESDDPETMGKVIIFNEEELDSYNRLLKIWVKPKKFRSTDWEAMKADQLEKLKQS